MEKAINSLREFNVAPHQPPRGTCLIKMIKNIIFDISGIFISSDEKDILNYYSKKLDIPLETVTAAHKKFMDSYEKGELTDQEYKKSFFGELNVEIDPDYWDIKLSFKKKNQEIFDFLKELSGYSFYFVSNEGEGYWKIVDGKFNISENFIDGVVSFQVGVRKPDPKIFKTLIEGNNLNPEECVFIDDIEKNLGGAESFGMKTINYKNVNKLRQDLNALGVKI